jgi:hypothetical protein
LLAACGVDASRIRRSGTRIAAWSDVSGGVTDPLSRTFNALDGVGGGRHDAGSPSRDRRPETGRGRRDDLPVRASDGQPGRGWAILGYDVGAQRE